MGDQTGRSLMESQCVQHYLQPICWTSGTLIIDDARQFFCRNDPIRIDLIQLDDPVMRKRVTFDDQLVIPCSYLRHDPSIARYTSCNSTLNRTAEKCFEKLICEPWIDFNGRKSGFERLCWFKDWQTSCMIPAVAIQAKSLGLLIRTEWLVAYWDT